MNVQDTQTPLPVAPRERVGWCLFDFANSAFVTLIITVVYPPYFASLAGSDRGDLAWSVVMAASLLVALVLSRVLGALADLRASKKRFLAASFVLCVVCCAALSFLGPEQFLAAAVCCGLANVGFSLGENFIAAFLPELAPPDRMGRLSGIGWAVGYFGGLASLVLALELVEAHAIRWVPLATAGFFLLAGLPTFLFLRERARPRPAPSRTTIRAAIGGLRRTWERRRAYPDLYRFLVSLFLEQAGVAIVVSFAGLYAVQALGATEAEVVKLFIGLQLAAAAGAASFGYVQDKVGGKPALVATIVVWVAAAFTALLADGFGTFAGGGVLAGLAMGSSQAAGRAMVGTFTPAGHQGEWFGLWGIAMKAASVLGVATYAAARLADLPMRQAMWSTVAFFLLSLLVLAGVDETRGRRAALAEGP